ncbi:MAG: hypothetical protein Q7K39_01540 [Candidatus Magasanikbacteria bacterium]|nr:hypothetical protein [Candidatus Magasanikbacteria bacterium]
MKNELVAEKIFNNIYAAVNGTEISTTERQKLNLRNSSLTYGEINFEAMQAIVSALGETAGKNFYDLGAGTGKAVILAALLANFKKTVGIELLPALYQAAEVARKKLVLQMAQEPRDQTAVNKTTAEVLFIRDNIFWADFSEADVVLVSTTCFDERMMEMLKRRLTMLRPGSLVITVSQSLHSGYYDIIGRFKINLKWGEATVFIHKKIY